MSVKNKRLLVLGGKPIASYDIVEYANYKGAYTIVSDYLKKESSPAKQIADECWDLSTADIDKLYEKSISNNINAVFTGIHEFNISKTLELANKLNLPFYASKEQLQTTSIKSLYKELFRKFNVPVVPEFNLAKDTFEEDLEAIEFPVLLKPVDAAGSKGVTKVETIDQLRPALEEAMKNSLNAKEVIIEDYIESKGYASDTDSFSINSDLQFISFASQLFNSKVKNPYTPAAFSWPAEMKQEHQDELANELRRLVKLLNLGTSIYNVEVRVGTNNKPYIMEISPRGGGNRLSEMLRYATGTDLITHAVKAAIGEPVDKLEMPKYNGYWAEIILHSEMDGEFDSLYINPKLKDENIIETDLWVKEGDKVNNFNAANDAIGTLVLRFDTAEQLQSAMKERDELVKVVVK